MPSSYTVLIVLDLSITYIFPSICCKFLTVPDLSIAIIYSPVTVHCYSTWSVYNKHIFPSSCTAVTVTDLSITNMYSLVAVQLLQYLIYDKYIFPSSCTVVTVPVLSLTNIYSPVAVQLLQYLICLWQIYILQQLYSSYSTWSVHNKHIFPSSCIVVTVPDLSITNIYSQAAVQLLQYLLCLL